MLSLRSPRTSPCRSHHQPAWWQYLVYHYETSQSAIFSICLCVILLLYYCNILIKLLNGVQSNALQKSIISTLLPINHISNLIKKEILLVGQDLLAIIAYWLKLFIFPSFNLFTNFHINNAILLPGINIWSVIAWLILFILLNIGLIFAFFQYSGGSKTYWKSTLIVHNSFRIHSCKLSFKNG